MAAVSSSRDGLALNSGRANSIVALIRFKDRALKSPL